jgi:tetratricopeptide (TPR) repeat protein
MITLRFLALALLVCAVVVGGCSSEQPSEQAAVTGGEAPPEAGEAAETVESGELSPPSAGQSFKEKRLAEALRGLDYGSGRVVVDTAAADPLPGAEQFASAADAYQRGLYYLFEKNDRVAAIGALTRAVIMAPDNPEHLTGLGQALLRKGKGDEAIASFNTALDLAPDHFEARKQLAWALQMSGDYQSSRQAWLRVLDLDPDHGEAHGRLAVLEYYLEDYESAWASVARAEDLGYEVPPQFLPLLREKMPPPAK